MKLPILALSLLLLSGGSLLAGVEQQSFPFPLGVGSGIPGIPGMDLLCSLGPVGGFSLEADAVPRDSELAAFNLARRALVSECFPDPNCGNAVLISNETVSSIMSSAGQRGVTVIRYSPDFTTQVVEDFGPDGLFALFAHEWGHHFDRQVPTSWMAGAWGRELRADAWTGCALAVSGRPPDIVRLMLLVLSTFPSLEHPAFPERVDAFQAGYSRCGGLGQLLLP